MPDSLAGEGVTCPMLSTTHNGRLGGVVIEHFFVLALHWL